MSTIGLSTDRLYALVGRLVIENAALRETCEAQQTSEPSNDKKPEPVKP